MMLPITAGIVVNDSNEEWPYTTTGHATVVRGIRSDNQLVQLADPGVKYWNSTLNSYFMVSSDELYKAVSYSSKASSEYMMKRSCIWRLTLRAKRYLPYLIG